jgi:hypothetical protein
MTPQLQRVMDFIEAEIAVGRGFPTRAAIAQHMGWKNGGNAATSVLLQLVGVGRLTKSWDGGRWSFGIRDREGAL